ncbi:MAG: bifunctional diaminohydroxyphosphoribosylaminopyrimidine deaminase/5-amino-6-(5-phosphoribosylamino)uracil reductase RibD [Rikenellaceae bacterium]|nr:bifunctional diaminohydroxyphosphoribosylaminopyrimidine deaminase/5-amino-6-(5-phosphoribosylamino)uracil reductase RibD [Rikenellaceae bacterium]
MKEEAYMKRCLELAALGAGSASPNPLVGCVIVHQGRIIGEGWHRQYGGPHAEVNAVADAEANGHGPLLQESTLYVNLEPCSHWGKTPPCADLLIEKGIPRVVVGCIDSYCEVSGRGIAKMREAGIDVTVGMLEKECLHFNRRFFTAQNEGRPYIILKWAQTSDGYLDAVRPSAEIPAAWMTGEAAKILVHRWRAEEDAILVGTRTALLDNPSLTVRAWQGRHPLRVVPDRHLTLPPELNIFNGEAQTVLFTAASNKVAAKSRFAGKPNVSIEIFGDLEDLLQALRREPYRVQSVMIEGGAQLLNSVIGTGLWDEARVFTAPMALNELYPAIFVPDPIGIPAPILPATAKITGELPAVGLKIFERG